MSSCEKLKEASLSNNRFRSIPSDALENMPKLTYIGLDMNEIETVTKRSCKFLAESQLRFLELHHNDIQKIGNGVFKDIPNLLHLRLHSQKDGFKLSTVSHSAFKDAGQNITTLFLGENGLKAVPHGMFNYGNFESLEELFLDSNEITNASEISRNDFSGQSDALYDTLVKDAKPFKGLRNLAIINLQSNHLREQPLIASRSVEIIDFSENSIASFRSPRIFSALANVEEIPITETLIVM
eukprot:XP_011677428.1 PREDICTED: fibromodulin-like [Strongylocentrotus purpuratus]